MSGLNLRQRVALWTEPGWARRARADFDRTPLAEWVGIDAVSAAVFSVALAEQLPPGHRLKGARWRAIGRVDGLDDILFAASDGLRAVVHLTWQKETDPRWPRAAVFASHGQALGALAALEEDDPARG